MYQICWLLFFEDAWEHQIIGYQGSQQSLCKQKQSKARDVLNFKEEKFIFQRIKTLKEDRVSVEIDLRKCLQYEISNNPSALLDESDQMRDALKA